MPVNIPLFICYSLYHGHTSSVFTALSNLHICILISYFQQQKIVCFLKFLVPFYSFGNSPLPVGGCKFWACNTFCDTGHPLIMVITEDPWHTYCRVSGSGTVTTYLNDLGLSRLEFEHQPFACVANALTHCVTAAIFFSTNLFKG